MKYILSIITLLLNHYLFSQANYFPVHLNNTQISKLKKNDSLIYYQCHVEGVKQEITTSSGQKITSNNKKLTITEKFVIIKTDTNYLCKYFISSFTNYPNKKFAYLTLKENANWEFALNKTKFLSQQQILLLAAIETKAHAITHYELNINKSCTNEIILHSNKIKEQLILEEKYLIRKIIE